MECRGMTGQRHWRDWFDDGEWAEYRRRRRRRRERSQAGLTYCSETGGHVKQVVALLGWDGLAAQLAQSSNMLCWTSDPARPASSDGDTV
jgi:hypothetical protein